MTPRLSNRAVADLLERHGRLLEIAGESPFRTRAYSRAAEAIRLRQEPLAEAATEGRLREIPGVGEGIAAALSELLETGSFAAHVELTARYPESLLELTTIPGIGTKTALKLFTTLGIDSIESLESASETGKIANEKSLGTRLDGTIREGLASLRRRTGRVPLGMALPVARAFAAAYAQARSGDIISLAGSARRWEITVDDLDFVIATASVDAAINAIAAISMAVEVERVGDFTARADLEGGLTADIYFTDRQSWGSSLVQATGSARHLERLGTIPERASSEEAVYAAHGLPWIPPELRAGDDEFERWPAIPSLVTLADINGEFHTHTTWSDGTASIAEMANAAAARGYTFLGITDHSHGLGVAGGLDPERLASQRTELSEVDGTAGVRLLAGAEVEVHRDGSLDYNEAILAGLDVVVASLHTGLRQPRDELTARAIRVLENPNVDIIAHPSGRLIERREGGDFDWDRIFAAAATTGTALEINADPARLDLDPHHARQASDAGCLITINCDAHRPSGFALMEYGVAMARRAWLTPGQILNCWPRDQMLEWLSTRGRPA